MSSHAVDIDEGFVDGAYFIVSVSSKYRVSVSGSELVASRRPEINSLAGHIWIIIYKGHGNYIFTQQSSVKNAVLDTSTGSARLKAQSHDVSSWTLRNVPGRADRFFIMKGTDTMNHKKKYLYWRHNDIDTASVYLDYREATLWELRIPPDGRRLPPGWLFQNVIPPSDILGDILWMHSYNITKSVVCWPKIESEVANVSLIRRGVRVPDDVRVVFKSLVYNFKNPDALTKRLVLQAAIWTGLEHKNILKLYGLAYIAPPQNRFDVSPLSFVSKDISPGNWWRYRALYPHGDIDQVVLGVAEGLNYLHNYEGGAVIHGDIKPENILVDKYGQARLCDFGLSVVLSEYEYLPWSDSLMRAGSRDYLAPEAYIMLGQPHGAMCLSKKTDIWAFGLTALEMYRGRSAYAGLNEDEIKRRIAAGWGPDDVSENSARGITARLLRTLAPCWSRNPDNRPTAAMLVDRF